MRLIVLATVILSLSGCLLLPKNAPRLKEPIETYKYIPQYGDWCRSTPRGPHCVHPAQYHDHVLLSEGDLLAIHLYIEELYTRCKKWRAR